MSLQVEKLENSFEKVKPQADAFVVSFYDNLFADYPQAKPLFEETDMAKQGKKLLQSLVLVIENLRKPDVLGGALKGLGARHVQYGALPEHYPLVGNTLLKTFAEYLGTEWTDDVQQAWVDAYGAITTIMLEGAEYSDSDLSLTSTPAPMVPTELASSSTQEIVGDDRPTGLLLGLAGGGIIAVILALLLV